MNKIAASIAVAIFFLVLDIGSQGRLPAQRLTFSGYEWEIRRTSEPEGPADNRFGGRDLSVFLTEDKALQLSLAYSEGVWWAGEVYIRKRLGYGTYVFRLDSDPARLDPNLVLGLFTYASNSSYAHREIDIEFSAWGVKGAPTLGQFVVQPYQNQGHVKYFPLGAVQGPASYSFTWLKDSVDFAAWKGHGPRPSRGDRSIIAEWTFADKSAVPPSSTERVHINLYLAHGNEPPSGRGVTSVLIRSFEFTPANK